MTKPTAIIPKKLLRAVRTIVTHEGCADGIASAILCAAVLPRAQVKFVQYGTPALRDLPATRGLLFVDMTPPKERVAEFVAVDAIVLDHHRTAQGVVAQFKYGIYADTPGVSGAVLAYRHVWAPLFTEDLDDVALQLATLVGVRDTWQQDAICWEEASALSDALLFYPPDYWTRPTPRTTPDSRRPVCDRCGKRHRHRHEEVAAIYRLDHEWPTLLKVGAFQRQHSQTFAQLVADGAYRYEQPRPGLPSWRVALYQGLGHVASDAATALGTTVDFSMGWAYFLQDGQPMLTVSLRSRSGGVDVGAFAQFMGGGGHAAAAGFSVPVVPSDDLNPYAYLQDCLERWAATLTP